MTRKFSRSLIFILTFSLFSSLLISSALAKEVKIPAREQGYVSDFANLLKPNDKLAITKFASELEKKTTAQLKEGSVAVISLIAKECGALSRLLVAAERYPDLKSNENFLALQAQLEGTKNRIVVERTRYNRSVKDFNRFQCLFFGRFFASQAGVTEPAVYFEAVESASKVPEVKF